MKNSKRILSLIIVLTMIFSTFSFAFGEEELEQPAEATIEINPSAIYPGGELEVTISALGCANLSSYNLYLLDENNDMVKNGNRPVQYAAISFDSEGNGTFSYKGETNKIKFDETNLLKPGIYYLGIANRMDWEVIASAKFIVKDPDGIEEPEVPADESTAKLDKTEVALGESVTVDVHIANWEPAGESDIPGPPSFDYQVNLYQEGSLVERLGGGKSEDTDEEGNSSFTFTIPEDIEAGEYTININIVRCDTKEIELPITIKELESTEATIEISPKVVALDGKLEVNVKLPNYEEYINAPNSIVMSIDIFNSDTDKWVTSLGDIDFDSEGNGFFDNGKIIDLGENSNVAEGCKVGSQYYIGLVTRIDKDDLEEKVLAKTPIEFTVAGVDKIKPKLTIKGLENETVTTEEITFTVLAEDDVDGIVEPKVTATSDETKIELVSKENGVYTYKATMMEGNNTITIAATDKSGNEASRQYWVTYANPKKDKMEIIVNGIQDNMEVTEKEISFMVFAKNGYDKKAEEVTVKLNDKKIEEFNGQYKASLNEGANTIEIYATDNKGNEAREKFTINYKPTEVDPKDLPKIDIEGLEDYEIVYNGDAATIKVVAKDKDGKEIEPKVFVKNGMMLKGGAPVPTGNTEPIQAIQKQKDSLYHITFAKDPKNISGINEIKEVIVEATDEQGRKGTISKKVLYNGCGTVVFTETREIIKKDIDDENKEQDLTIYLGTEFEDIKGSKYLLGIEPRGKYGYYRTPSDIQIVKEGIVGEDGKVVDTLTIPKDIEPGEYWINFYFYKNDTNATINFKVNQETDTIAPEIKAHFRDFGIEEGETCEIHSNFAILKATAYDLTDGPVDVTVMLNGEKVERIEPVGYCRYRLDLKEGTNTIVITAKDKAGNNSKEEYTIISTKDNLNKIRLENYRANVGSKLEFKFDMSDYKNEEIDLILYNCDMDYYHKAPREFYIDQGLPETNAFYPYVVKTKLDENGQLTLDYNILDNVRSGYYMLETSISGSTYRSPMFYVLGNEPDIIPPEIYLRGIEDGFVYNENQVEFSVVANDMRDGEVEPLVKVNGEVVELEVEGNYVANLVEGDNTIEVIAEDNSGNIATKQISIEYVKVDINDESVVKMREALKNTSEYLKENATYSSDWKVVGIANAGKAVQKDYLEGVESWAKEKNATSDKVTDYERIALGVAAAGGDPRNVGGYNLIDKIYNYDEQGEIYFQGLNGVIYALTAMDTNRYFVPDTALYTREKLVDYILEKQNDDGGWNLYMDGNSDVDITSMTLISLAPYHDRTDVVEAVEKACDWLSSVQREDNSGFNSWGSEDNSESVSQTIIGLCANGIDPTSDKFIKNGNSLIDALLSFAQDDGTFLHIQPGTGELGVTGMSTEQAYQALLAYDKFVKMGRESKNGKASIYYFGEKLADTKGLIMGADLDKDDNQAVKINIENLGDEEQEVLLIIGVYDEENRMVDSVKVVDIIGKNENKVIYKEYITPEDKDYTIKALLWDNLEGQNPLKAHPIMLKAN